MAKAKNSPVNPVPDLGRLPTCSYPVTKVPQVLPERHHLPIYQPPVWPSHGPIGVHKPCERSQAYSPTTRNQTTPIFGRLVDSSSFQTGLHRTNTKTTKTGERPRICSKPQEVRTHTLSEVRLPRIPFFVGHGSCEAHARQVNKASGDVPSPLSEVCYQCKDSYVHHLIACINGEDCKTGQDTYETLSVTSQNSLEISDASGHTNSLESEDDTTQSMVVRPSKRATRRVSPPKGTRNTNLYRRLKCRMGFARIHRRALLSTRKTPTHQSFRTEDSFSGSTILQKELQQLSPHSLRQHLIGVIHQQTGWNKISSPMRTDLENSYLVPQQQGNTQSKARAGFTQCYRGRPLQEEPDPVNRVVPFSSNIQESLQNMGESPSGPVCNQPEQKAPPLCLSDSRPSGLGSRCPEHPMGKPGCIYLSSHCRPSQGDTKTPVSSMQVNLNHPRLDVQAMVLGPCGDVSGHTQTTTTYPHPAQTTTEQPLPGQPNFPESQRRKAERFAAPHRLSTRAIYSSKWTVFQRWCT